MQNVIAKHMKSVFVMQLVMNREEVVLVMLAAMGIHLAPVIAYAICKVVGVYVIIPVTQMMLVAVDMVAAVMETVMMILQHVQVAIIHVQLVMILVMDTQHVLVIIDSMNLTCVIVM